MHKNVYDNLNETVYHRKLSNGLTVILIPKKQMNKTYALFTTNYGSIDQSFIPIDQKQQITVPQGIAHFLEHKLFEKEDRDVFADFGKQGASANAYTSFTKTAYLFTATSHIKQNVQTLLDFVQEPYFSDASVEKEKGIIAQEIKMYDDQPSWQSFMGTVSNMFPNHYVKHDIAGTVESIQQITKEDLYTCYNTFYHPSNMVFFMTGNFEAEDMMAFIEENQSSKTFIKAQPLKTFYPEEKSTVGKKESTKKMPVSIPKTTIGIKELARKITPEEFLEKDLLQTMVLDYFFSTGGPFYETLYNENLIDGSFNYSVTLEKNFGYSLIGGNTTDPTNFAHKVKDLLLSTSEMNLSKDIVDTMKKKQIGQYIRAMNSLEYIANQYTHYHMLNIDFFSIIPTIQSFTEEDINQFLTNWIEDDRLSVFTLLND